MHLLGFGFDLDLEDLADELVLEEEEDETEVLLTVLATVTAA